ncbi:SirB2 family protein [Celerinatantimonas sp. YJH-8]|uniref:SirB2 family protein n=1 Tax=Celerinatantimonas sp. YJH-8 TaxID=3228714 RepID=UPI0038C19454
MMSYFNLLINVHIASAIISFCGFVYRWQLALRQSPQLQHPFLRISPHVIDTLLLGSGIWLCVLLGVYPFWNNWLTAKLLLLIVYIGVGTMAIKRAKNQRQQAVYGIVAIVIFALITLVALDHQLV